MKGKFFGLGVGPGDPELLTLKAYRILNEVDVICMPKSRLERECVAYNIVRPLLRGEKEIVELYMPMTRDAEILEQEWQKGAATILAFLRRGLDVAFITIGDAMLYSTYSYLMAKIKALDEEIEITTVPGITSFAATAAALNIPLAEGEERLAIVPSIENPQKLPEVLAQFPNVVLMKVAPNFNEILDVLEAEKVQDKAVLVSHCSTPRQQCEYDLERLRGSKPDYLSLILVKQQGRWL
ncbi:MAG TPA: precorrin-2 C(20)-methyltransferase [Firmicutes bacterium]|nr:precorrin-2 C(20)-methyltransferase [Bacillota bacterium]HWR56230.1 precorrin-2 C(20)-methyltransferase [Negativicutes bacterium]